MYISPFGDIKYETLQDMLDEIYNCCEKNGKKYIYAYHSEPDSTIHELGTGSEKVRQMFEDISNKTEELCKKLKDDTIVIVVADHGHLNCE
jgi:predicted AlkP superfamily pyrophosphatase or phosphodiesterase